MWYFAKYAKWHVTQQPKVNPQRGFLDSRPCRKHSNLYEIEILSEFWATLIKRGNARKLAIDFFGLPPTR